MPAYILGLGDIVSTVLSRCYREGGVAVIVVVMHPGNVGGKDESVSLVNGYCRILPPKKIVLYGRAVSDRHSRLKIRAIGAQNDSHHALGSVCRRMLGEPYYNASVRFGLYIVIHGHYRRGSVVEGPVELYTARDPRAVRADERRLDNVLTVEKIVARDLIVSLEHSAAEVGNDSKAYIFIFKSDDSPLFIKAMLTISVRNNSVGIRISRRSLMIAGLGEHRHLLCLGDRIGRYIPFFYRYFYG